MFTHLDEVIRWRAKTYPSSEALGGQQGLAWKTLTSHDLLVMVDRLAIELRASGIREGDRVVLWVPNHWRTPVYLFAIWQIGAVVVPFDREMNPEAAGAILDSVEPRVVLIGYGERPAWLGEHPVADWWEPGTIAASGISPTTGPHPGEELAAIFFTSGTTGRPKGCMITHANLCAQVDALGDNIPLDPSCRLASILPLSHLFELTCGLLYPLSRGAAIHYVPSRRGPDVLRVLNEQRISHLVAVPQLLTIMGQNLDTQVRVKIPAPIYAAMHSIAPRLSLGARRKLFWLVHRRLGGHLRMIAYGGAALPTETHLLWERLGVRIIPGYGASECSPVITAGLPDGSTPVGSVGRPIRGVEVRLAEGGELLVRGPNVMRGYWTDPDRTAEVLRDNWYATGDLATIDGDGNVRLVGRAKDLIVLPSGLNVWPQDVEDVLRSDPAIKDATVIAVPARDGGARLHAYLIPSAASRRETSVRDVVARANARLAQHQRIATASWWGDDDFPRTTTLKVRRNILPVPRDDETVEIASVLAADDPVGLVIAGMARVARVLPTQSLGELGLDSLGLVELALRLEEKTGQPVADGDLRLDMTVSEVRDLLGAASSSDGESIDNTVSSPREAVSAEQPLWPYTWGRIFRACALPFDLLYRLAVTRTVILGGEHLANLPSRVIFAGTHRSFADLVLVRHALAKTPAAPLARRLVIPAGAGRFGNAGALAQFAVLAFGLYPLRQYGEREASLRGLARTAKAGNAVLIFPQGRHTDPKLEIADDPIARFRPGVAHLAAALDAAVIPIGIAGTEQVLPPSAEHFRGLVVGGIPVSLTRRPVAIAFGEQLHPSPGESPVDFSARIQAVCFSLARAAENALAGI